MSNNLFILSNNTHYLVAKKYLALHPNNNGNNYLIITLKPFQSHKNFIDLINEERLFKAVFIIRSNSPLKVIFNIFYLNLISLKIRNIENIFISSYYQWIQHYIVKLFDFKNVILLNDGANIFSIVELRKKIRDVNFQIKNPLFKKIIRLPQIEKLTYFTQFNLDIESSLDNQINFSFEKNENSSINQGLIFFIGSPLIDSNILDYNLYIRALQDLKMKNTDKKIWYFAHRRESQKYLIEYESIVDKVIINEEPFEEYLLSAPVLPYAIFSFYSTAILNLFPVYKEINFYSYEIKERHITIGDFKKERILKLYNDMHQINAKNFGVISYD